MKKHALFILTGTGMLCKHCHYEFYVSADSLGSKVRCPNCTGTVNVVDKQIICPCPECGGMLDISIWMLGSSSSCPHCQKSIILSLGEDSAKYLPENKHRVCNKPPCADRRLRSPRRSMLRRYQSGS